MDPISIEKIRAMRKYRRNRKQQQLLPALAPYLVATCGVLCQLLTSPAWLAPKSQPTSIVDVDNVHEEYVKRSDIPMTTKMATTTVAFSGHSASVEAVWEGEKEREKEGQERVDDFIARVKRQRKLEGKSFFDTDQ
ncbi:hypothetical protein VPH35_062418 [Triticum aestivum]|uniref:Uncharacterized protein n=1 Tax=Aegilops tauschii TaxID=37682 RepID=M8CXT2_AEGTA